jgi:hypothetical protein
MLAIAFFMGLAIGVLIRSEAKGLLGVLGVLGAMSSNGDLVIEGQWS